MRTFPQNVPSPGSLYHTLHFSPTIVSHPLFFSPYLSCTGATTGASFFFLLLPTPSSCRVRTFCLPCCSSLARVRLILRAKLCSSRSSSLPIKSGRRGAGLAPAVFHYQRIILVGRSRTLFIAHSLARAATCVCVYVYTRGPGDTGLQVAPGCTRGRDPRFRGIASDPRR